MAITITEGAAREIKRVIEDQALGAETLLRVVVEGGGCSGFSYGLGFGDTVEEGDEVFDQHGLRVVVDPRSNYYLEGTTIDFKNELSGRGFTFDNPLAAKTCGCNKSFSPKDGLDEPPPKVGGCGTCSG